jgi:hypothetical protein
MARLPGALLALALALALLVPCGGWRARARRRARRPRRHARLLSAVPQPPRASARLAGRPPPTTPHAHAARAPPHPDALPPPAARAGCAIAKIEDTNFVSQPVKGMGPSKVCFTIATQACTNASAPCCFASPPPIKSVMLSGVSSKCSGGKAIRGLSVSVDGGTPTRASRGPVSGGINLRLKGAAPGQQICVELSGGCGAARRRRWWLLGCGACGGLPYRGLWRAGGGRG